MEGDRGVQCACRAFLWSGPTISGGAQVTSLDSAQLVVNARVGCYCSSWSLVLDLVVGKCLVVDAQVGCWCSSWLMVHVWLLVLKLVVGAQFSFWC